MARGNTRGDDDDNEVSHHRHFHWSLKDIPRFEGKNEQPFLHLMEFEDYLVASAVSIEPEEVRGNTVQPDYKDIINKFKASLKNNPRIWFNKYIEKRVSNLHSADGWKTIKSKFLTYFNPLSSTKEQQIKAWKEIIWKPEEEKLTDFVFRFSQLAYELGYSDEQQISHFVLCIPGGLYLYLKGALTIPDAVEKLSKGIALGGLYAFNSIPTTVQDDSKPPPSIMTMKENKTQFTTEDTLGAVKESIQDSMYDNNKTLGRLLDEIGDRLANVVDDFQSEHSSRDRDRNRSQSKGRNRLRDDCKNRNRDRDRDDGRDHSIDNYRDRDRGRSNIRNRRSERRKHQRSGTGQRYFDRNEFCNYCDRTGHTTHRCFKPVDYLKR